MPKKKVIYDTDPGIDDAMALLFLHYSPEIELVGITTTFGNGTIETTTRNALYLCDRFGIAAPVAAGHPTPLEIEPLPPGDFVHGGNGLGDIPLPDRIDRQPDPRIAHRFIIDMVRAHPGEISLVAVGRMTNLALALREAPEIAGLVREVVIMGGAFGHNGHLGNATPAAEANIIGDPHAADEIFAADWPLTVVGLDVTNEVELSRDDLRTLAETGGDAGRFIWDTTRFYEGFYHSVGLPEIVIHDASAVACLLDPSLFTTRSGPIRVVVDGIAHGMTIQQPASRRYRHGPWSGRPSHQVCVGVDRQRLKDRFCAAIIAGGNR